MLVYDALKSVFNTVARKAKMAKPKHLVAFDFDHTIIDGNSDMHVMHLAPNGELPKHVRTLESQLGWTKYMGAIFEFLHHNGVTPDQMLDCMKEIPFVKGMGDLFEFLSDGDVFDVIIISDSNSVFIEMIMSDGKMAAVVDKVYTNPAGFNNKGCLQIEYYHTQDWCDLSSVNLCKGHILQSHIEEARKRGVAYKTVSYVGDGTNDYCPALRLSPSDFVFARKGFGLLKKIGNSKQPLSCKVVPWENAYDILKTLQPLTSS